MKFTWIILFTLLLSFNLNAQKFIAQKGYIYFFSETPVEDIKADNFSVSSALDAATGNIVFKVPVKSFEFEKKLMQEHFNENYMESDKFPDAVFKGKITNLEEVNFNEEDRYKAIVEGDLTIHGVTRTVKEEGEITVTGGKVYVKANFYVKPADYNIEIPKIVREKIAESILISVDINYDPAK